MIAGGHGMPCNGMMGFDREERPSASAGGGVGGGDYFGALPDDVLLLILVRLPAADAARTTALSRRWREIYAGVQGVFLALPGTRARLRFWGRPRRYRRRPRFLHTPPPPGRPKRRRHPILRY
ncbi:unnamed protein product [Urochloa decumbens]|uniref:F-box domain-containing protein n=1 Tax=Urochloa decumbens TaxID=240449 RepID=A0ABC9DYP9_9POAL